MMDESFGAAASRLQGLRVLIVENSWVIAEGLQSLLEAVGMMIAGPAATAADAELIACECTPELAIVDIQLRDGMAFGLIDRLQDLGVRVIVVTGFAAGSFPVVKAAAILEKPVRAKELLAALNTALRMPGEPASN
jgi:DNA-binding response OmpR family regulator